MATRSLALHEGEPAHETFYVVRQNGSAEASSTVTVVHGVPPGAEELGAFDSPNVAVEFAEAIVHNLKVTGFAIEMVDPPYGLVGAG